MAQNDLKKLLNPNNDGELAGVIRRAREMGELTEALCADLPDEYATAISAANLRDDGTLVVIAASPAWASRLRYETDALIDAVRKSGKTVIACRIRVSPG